MKAIDMSNFTTKFDKSVVEQWVAQDIRLAIVQLISGVKLSGDSCAKQIELCLEGGMCVDCYYFPGNDGLPLSTSQRLGLIPADYRVSVRQIWVDIEPATTNASRNTISQSMSVVDDWAPWQSCGQYCLTPEARVLTMDLDWVHAGELRVGDEILGFDESTGSDGRVSRVGDRRARRYKPATVTAAERQQADVFELELADGKLLYATGEHQWLVGRYGDDGAYVKPLMWAKTSDLASKARVVGTDGRSRSLRHASLARFFDPWNTPDGYSAGFLAAAFDGEGHLNWDTKNCRVPRLGFAQKQNAMLDAVRVYLDQHGYQHDGGHQNAGCLSLRLTGGVNTVFRFLGEMRPPRLMDKWRLASSEGVPFEMRSIGHVPIEKVRFVGTREIAAISSSSQTYISEGYGSHNTALWVASKYGWLPWPWPDRKQWLVNSVGPNNPNLGGGFSGTNNHVMTQYWLSATVNGVSGIDVSQLSDSEEQSVLSWLGGPMAIVVGEGMQNQMTANGDAPLCDHVNYTQTDSDGNSYQVEKCVGSKGLYISSNSSGQWVNVGPLGVG